MTACMLAKNYRLSLRTGLGEIFEKLLGIYDEERDIIMQVVEKYIIK